MTKIEPDPDAPTCLDELPDYWDKRREREGKPDLSRCGAELRVALQERSATIKNWPGEFPNGQLVGVPYRMGRHARGLRGERVVIMRSQVQMSAREALVHAAWLVVMAEIAGAEEAAAFPDLLERVRNA